MKFIYYKFRFLDGYTVICRGMSETEIRSIERKHGKVISITYDGKY